MSKGVVLVIIVQVGDDFFHQHLLAGKVVVDTSLQQTASLPNIRHGGSVIASVPEQVQRFTDDKLAVNFFSGHAKNNGLQRDQMIGMGLKTPIQGTRYCQIYNKYGFYQTVVW